MTAAQNSDIVTRLNRILSGADERGLDETECLAIRDAADEIERLRKERDEARRDVCDMMHMTGFLAGDYAASRGWDCFPDMKRNVSEDVKNFRFILERDYDRVVAERDEARRLYCDHVILHGTAHLINGNKGLDEITDAQSLARHLGWDYCND